MGAYTPKSVADSLKRQRDAIAKAGTEVDAIQTPKLIVPPITTPPITSTKPKATGLPEVVKPKGTFSVIEESKRKIEEMRKKGYIK